MATHSSGLAWRIPGTGEPGGLPSMGSHRVGHDWNDLAAAAAAAAAAALGHLYLKQVPQVILMYLEITVFSNKTWSAMAEIQMFLG